MSMTQQSGAVAADLGAPVSAVTDSAASAPVDPEVPAAPASDPKGPAIGAYNKANVVAYVLNSVVTYTSLTGIFGETNTDLSKKYQTLITPSGAAFSIWGPIFIGELVFVIAQLTGSYRSSVLVPVVTPWWCAACCFQVFWTLAFAQESIALALVCMLCILFSLLGLMWCADRVPGLNCGELWLLRAPFSLHAGWITVASFLNLNVLADSQGLAPEGLLAMAVASLAGVLALTSLHALASPRPDVIICLVTAWAMLFIGLELQDPQDLLSTTRFNPYPWEPIVLKGLSGAALTVSCCSVALAAAAASLLVHAAGGKQWWSGAGERGGDMASDSTAVVV